MNNLLIVDDEKLVLSSLSEALKMFDDSLNIITAENGEEAERILSSAKVDLLITDLNMPVKNGYELLADMFKIHPDIPVIVMTASGCGSDCGMLQAINVTHIMTKPINFEKMLEMVHTILRDAKKKANEAVRNGFAAETTSEQLVNNKWNILGEEV